MDQYKRKLVDWKLEESLIPSKDMDEWYKGEHCNNTPTKSELKGLGLDAVSFGWLPEAPLIGPDTRVLALGSCFARYFILWLADHGFNRSFPISPYNALSRFGAYFESVSVIAQQFRWAFEEFESGNALWVDKQKQVFEATEEQRLLVRETLEQTDVLIMTLGLSEVWYDAACNEPLWRAIPMKYYDPERHVFRVETFSSTMQALETIDQLRERFLPRIKIIFTLSPVRLGATFRPVSALTANSVSKAILRAALDEFLRSRPRLLQKTYFYFPSYEMVTDFFRDPFREDNRHLCSYVPAQILVHFAKTYTTYEGSSQPKILSDRIVAQQPPDELIDPELQKVSEIADVMVDEDVFSGELLARVSELEVENARLKEVSDERLAVITQLESAANERLDVIRRLEEERRRQAEVIAQLERECAEKRNTR